MNHNIYAGVSCMEDLNMSNEAAIEIKNVYKKLSGRPIIQDFSLEVYKGEVLGLLGPNGAGKTTLIKMIVNLISIDSGKILIEGKDIAGQFEEAIRNVGAIVENPEFYKYMSGYRNLLNYARMYPDISDERIMEITRLVGLDDRIKDPVKAYSLGMRQRLGIAAALLHRPSVLILDEPTNGLDPEGIYELRNYLKKLAHEEKIAVMVSSHMLSEMELMCDRTAIIEHGKLIKIMDLNDKSQLEANKQFITVWEVNMNNRAADFIKSLNLNKCSVNEKGFTAVLNRNDIPDTIKTLIQNDIDIYRIEYERKSLEDAFMEITKGA